MNEFRQHEVSLRGSSAKEITRDALLQKVNQQRELRNRIRRSNAAVLLIQRVWRRHYVIETVALRMRVDWETMMTSRRGGFSRMEMGSEVLRPFLFFVEHLCVRRGRIAEKDRDCMMSCFRVVLENINSNDVGQNFCSMAVGSFEERRIWMRQSEKLLSVCLFILSLFDYSDQRIPDIAVTSMSMRLAVFLTEPKGWTCVTADVRNDVNAAVKNLVQFIGSDRSGLYSCIRKFICKLKVPFSSQEELSCHTDDRFLIMTSAITLSLRPFHIKNLDAVDNGLM